MKKYEFAKAIENIATHLDGVCERIFVENVPSAFSTPIDDYLVLTTNGVKATGLWQRTELQGIILVRDKKTGVQDTKRLDECINDLLSRFPYTDDYSSVIHPVVGTNGHEGEFSFVVISLSMTLKKTQ